MKKILVAAVVLLTAFESYAAYVVVMKDGTRYRAKAKWTVVKGKATFVLENGQSVSVDANLIDAKKSDEVTRLGMGDVSVLGVEQTPQTEAQAQAPSLGTAIRLRSRVPETATQQPSTTSTAQGARYAAPRPSEPRRRALAA